MSVQNRQIHWDSREMNAFLGLVEKVGGRGDEGSKVPVSFEGDENALN